LTNPYELFTNPSKHVTMVAEDVYKQKENIMQPESREDIVKMVDTIRILNETIEHFKTKIRPTATGHIHTTIGCLEERVEELTGILTHGR